MEKKMESYYLGFRGVGFWRFWGFGVLDVGFCRGLGCRVVGYIGFRM